MNNQRRKLLKGVVCGSVLSAMNLSTVAFASTKESRKTHNSGLRIQREVVAGKEQVTIINHSNAMVSLNTDAPISVTFDDGLFDIDANIDIKGTIDLDVNESLMFEIDAHNQQQIVNAMPVSNKEKQLYGLLNITSNHDAFNRTIAVTPMMI